MESLLENYNGIQECRYKNEHYSVRDNGAVFRMSRPNKRRRPLDDRWTFGNFGKAHGYMYLSSHAVHRIVAFAFLGEPPTENHIVDHIDTNRCNNRKENLRWVTRLENLILNETTLRRIIYVWGSLDNFFNNPNTNKPLEKNFEWMRTVSKEEAANCKQRMLSFGKSNSIPGRWALGEWVYSQPGMQQVRIEPVEIEELPTEIESLTPLALQRHWKTPTEFPCCPDETQPISLNTYLSNLKQGEIFSKNIYANTEVLSAEIKDEFISVLTHNPEEDAIKRWAVAKITVEGGNYIHENMGSFFELNGGKKRHFNLIGVPFEGESIDDYM